MGLSAARRSVDEHGIELHVVGMLGYAEPHAAWQFVAVAFDVVGKSLMKIELRIEILQSCIKGGLRLVKASCLSPSGFDGIGRVSLDFL